MSYWARLRRVGMLAAALLVLAFLMHESGYHRAWMPTVIGGGSNAVLWASFLPLGWAAAVCLSYETRGAQVEERPGRRLAVADVLLLLIATSVLASVFVLVGPYQGARLHVVAHVLVMSGLGTSVTVFAGAGNGIMAATTLLLVTSSYSPHLSGAKFVRVVEPEGDLAFSLIIGAALVATALLALWSRSGTRVGQNGQADYVG